MARPHATPEQREEIRRSIRKAAAELYRREGIAGISARSVAQRAGVSVGTIYAHFGDLTGLMQSLWTGHVERQNAVFRDVAALHAEPVARLRALLDAYLRFGIENAVLYRNAFLFVRPESQPAPEAATLAHADFPRLLLAAVREGQGKGSIVEGDPEALAQVLWSAVHGCLALPVNFDRIALQPPADLAQLTLDAALRGISRERQRPAR